MAGRDQKRKPDKATSTRPGISVDVPGGAPSASANRPKPSHLRTSGLTQIFVSFCIGFGIYTRSSRERWERAFCTAMHHKPAPIDALITFVTELLAHVERTAPTYASNARRDRTTHPIPFFGDVLSRPRR
jgi:hypothetical protein